MMGPCCAVCGESKSVNLFMFNYGVCLCHRCMEMAAQSFIHDTAERKLKESEKDVEGLSKAEYESMRELKDKLLKEIEADVEAKVRAAIEAKKRENRVAEEAIKLANGTHESLSCKCPGCGKLVPKKDMKRFQRGHFYGTYPSMFCHDCFEKKNMERDIQIADQELRKSARELNDLKVEYEAFKEYTNRLKWVVVVLGGAVGVFISLMFLNPK